MEIIKMSNAKAMNVTRTGLKLYCDGKKVGTVVAYDEAADMVSVEVNNKFAAMTENQEKMSQCHLEFKDIPVVDKRIAKENNALYKEMKRQYDEYYQKYLQAKALGGRVKYWEEKLNSVKRYYENVTGLPWRD